jgi:hypothetical protein
MSSNQRETAISFDFPHCQRVLVKPKLTKMGFNETRCNNIDRQKTNLQF